MRKLFQTSPRLAGLRRLARGRGGETGSIIRGGSWALAIRLCSAFLGYASTVFLARWLGVSQFGALGFAQAWLFALSSITPLGLAVAASRFVAVYDSTGDVRRLAGFVWFSRRTILGASAICAVTTITLALIFKARIDPAHFIALLVALAAVPAVALVTFNVEVTRSMGAVVRAYAPVQIGQPVFLMIIAGMLVWFGIQLNSGNVMMVILASYLVLLVGSRWLDPRPGSAEARVVEAREWLGASLHLLVVQMARLAPEFSVIIIGVILDPRNTALYTAGLRIAYVVTLSVYATSVAGLPKIAAMFASGRRGEVQAVLSDVAHWTFWPALAATLLLVVFGSFVLSLLGPDFAGAYPVMIIIAVGHTLNAAAGATVGLLGVTGHHAIASRVTLIGLVANMTMTAVAVPVFGIVGAAVAFSLASVLTTAAQAVVAYRYAGVRPSILHALFRRRI